jgi:hypothetical protein
MAQMNTVLDPPEQRENADEPGLVLGRPAEDRTFEMVEMAAGAATGVGLGAAIGGPIGAAVGGVVGAAVGIAAGEAVERAAGAAATRTDAEDVARGR